MSLPQPHHPDPWTALRRNTPARIALGRAGAAMPTHPWLQFRLAHATARDAVRAEFDPARLEKELQSLGQSVLHVRTRCPDVAYYLRYPDAGRRLHDESGAALAKHHSAGGCDLAVILADGLSPGAVHAHAPALLHALLPRLKAAGWSLAPVVIARFARVALQDEIGATLGARLALSLIGERPGLSSPRSLGAYLVYEPRPGRTDAERNCISNIHSDGLSYALAADVLYHLLEGSRRLRLSGCTLKVEPSPSLPAESPRLADRD